jgi:magnesium transporter
MVVRRRLMNNLPTSIIEFDLKSHQIQMLSIDDWVINENEHHKVYWIHCDLNQREIFNKIAKKIHLADQAVNLCGLEDTLPKLIESMDAITFRIQCSMMEVLDQKQEAQFGNLILHLTPRYCFTASYVSLPALLTFTESYGRGMKYAKTSCFMLFLILDNVINDFSNVMYDYELIADQIDSSLREIMDDSYNEVSDRKNQVMRIKRHAIAIRDILMRLSGRKIMVISEQCRSSLLNLFEHSQTIISEADAIRDLLNGILGRIDNMLMQKMNSTMKVLTAFAAIFLPLTLIAGIYGMNFAAIPELHWKFGYYYALALMLVCGLVLLYFFKKKKWF